MKPNNAELITMLLERSEIDLPHIKKAYVKQYGQDLTQDIQKKCGRDAGPLIAQIAAKTPGGPTKVHAHLIQHRGRPVC